MKLDKKAYKETEYKHYLVQLTYTWPITATSKGSALGMLDDEVINPKYTGDNDYIYPTKKEIVKVYADDDERKMLYEKTK